MRLREFFEVAKVKLSTDPTDYGAYVRDAGKSEPTTMINLNQIKSLFEPEEFGKMTLPKSSANVKKIMAGIKRGDKLPPILVRRFENGYQVLDGHHRYEAYKQMGVKQIPARIVDPKNIKKKEVGESIFENLLKDGPIRPADHFKVRLRQRGIDPAEMEKLIIDVIKRNKSEIEALEPGTRLALQPIKNKLGLSIVKVDAPKGPFYLLTTAHKSFLPRPNQPVFREDDELDKPTPTVGELAEKYHCSLIAVELQLKKGVKVEMEHTNKHRVAKEIALDHLGEDLYYYEKLEKVEKKKDESCGPNCTCPKCKGKKKGS